MTEEKKELPVESANGADPVAAVEAFQKGWIKEDIEWLKMLQPVLQNVALRHGRRIFAMSMAVGMISEAFGVLGSLNHGNKRGLQALGVAGQISNNLLNMACEGYGVTGVQLAECKGDIERAIALVTAPMKEGEHRSPSGIILNG